MKNSEIYRVDFVGVSWYNLSCAINEIVICDCGGTGIRARLRI